jgi:signal transduction histidine kinase
MNLFPWPLTSCEPRPKARVSNDRQIETVNDLLRVAQIDAGKIRLDKRTCNITKLVKELVKDQEGIFKGRKQSISFVNGSGPVSAIVDANRFRMAVENLINNASKYTPQNGKVKVSVVAIGDNVRVSIADNGVGIEEQDLSKLFKQFSRIPNELSDSAGGSGLGLYWANKVVGLHGGYIAVQSKPGEGSVFDIYTPMEDPK